MNRIPACVAFAGMLVVGQVGFGQQAVIVVRHAEKSAEPGAGQDPPLSPAGEARARALAEHLKDAHVDAVYATEYKRTRLTAEPLAKAVGQTVGLIGDEVIGALRERRKDQVVVIVAHAGTVKGVSTYVDQITGQKNNIVLGESDFDQMFILTPKKDGAWSIIRARYGKTSAEQTR